MKKIIITSILAIACFSFSFAQMQEEEFRQEMEQIEAQMADAFDLLEQSLQGGELLFNLDTMMFKMIPLDPNAAPDTYPNGDPYQLHQFLDQFFGAFSEENRLELEQFFEELEQNIPAPEDSDIDTQPGDSQENTKKKKRKKTRIYRL